MVEIIPSILQDNIEDFKKDLEKVWGLVSRAQVDVIDGVFVPRTTVAIEDLTGMEVPMQMEAHLMVDKPEKWVERCAQAGFVGIIGQVERMWDKVGFIAKAQEKELRVGLGFDIDTELIELEDYIDDLDMVLLMSVKAGAQGREFDERVLSKIQEVRKMSKEVVIAIDGGLNVENIKRCLVAEWAEEMAEEELNKDFLGMEFCVGSGLLQAVEVKKELERLRRLGK